MKKNYLLYCFLFIILILPSVACNLGRTIDINLSATQKALEATQTAISYAENQKPTQTLPPTSNNIVQTEPTNTPEWLIPKTSIYLTQIEMPPRESQKPNEIVEFKIHYGNWSNVSIPAFNIQCSIVSTNEVFIIENVSLEPTKDGISSCYLKLPNQDGSFSIKAILDPEKNIEHRENSEIVLINNGYIE